MGWCFLVQGDLPNPGIKPASPVSPAFAGRFFTTEPPGEQKVCNALQLARSNQELEERKSVDGIHMEVSRECMLLGSLSGHNKNLE